MGCLRRLEKAAAKLAAEKRAEKPDRAERPRRTAADFVDDMDVFDLTEPTGTASTTASPPREEAPPSTELEKEASPEDVPRREGKRAAEEVEEPQASKRSKGTEEASSAQVGPEGNTPPGSQQASITRFFKFTNPKASFLKGTVNPLAVGRHIALDVDKDVMKDLSTDDLIEEISRANMGPC